MTSIRPMAQQVLRFSGVHTKVLEQLGTERLKKDSKLLFGENLDVFVKRDPKKGGTVELVAHAKNPKSLAYSSGVIRHLNRTLTGKDIQPITDVAAAPTKNSNPFNGIKSAFKGLFN